MAVLLVQLPQPMIRVNSAGGVRRASYAADAGTVHITCITCTLRTIARPTANDCAPP